MLLARSAVVFAAPVTATWDANPESNIAGYKLSYGTQSGVYTTTVDVGNVTSWPLTLGAGKYYFVVRAYDTGGVTSSYSSPNFSIQISSPLPDGVSGSVSLERSETK